VDTKREEGSGKRLETELVQIDGLLEIDDVFEE